MWAIPRYETCGSCGAQILAACWESHCREGCDPVRKLNYEYEQARPESFADDWAAYLESPAGSFSEYYAERRR